MLAMAILFAQFAIAAYACPATPSGAAAGTQDMTGMPCAEMMAAGVALDSEQPVLCMQHCQFGSTIQATDHVTPGVAPSAALPATLTLCVDDRRELALSSWAEREHLRDRPPPLPHSVVHCCYRI